MSSITRPNRILKAKSVYFNKLKGVHDIKYDYSKFDYKSAIEKTIIICPKHGEFLQSPHMHLQGHGCKLCSWGRTGKTNSQTKNSFIIKANKKFNNLYNYDKVNFINNKTAIEIICTKHGSFWQQPAHHLQSTGCPRCIYDNTTGGYNLKSCEKNKKNWQKINAKFYFITCYNENETFYKIGVTVKEKIKYRFGRLPYKFDVIDIKESNLYDCILLEHNILKNMKDKKYVPLIKFKGFTECLKLVPQDIEHLNRLKK